MLIEALESALTLTTPSLRRLGHAYAAAALCARARRQKRAWADHWQRTQAAILDGAGRVPGRGTVLVLGSGPCHDVPVAALAARFSRVVLVDAAHPPAARWLARRHAAVDLRVADLAAPGGCAALLDASAPDLVLSVNLLSQLPLAPLARLSGDQPADQDLAAAGRAIIQAHLDCLRACLCPALLVADVARTITDAQGRRQVEDPLFGLSLPPGPEWDWPLAPPGELPDGRCITLRVRAVDLAPAAPAPGLDRGARITAAAPP